MRNQRNKKRKKSRLPLLALLIVAATLVAAGLFFAFTGETEECLIKYEGEHLDDRAQKIKTHFWEKNESNKEGDFSYEIETNLLFEGQEQTCKINLVNPYCNTKLMYIELSIDGDDTVFFRSGLLLPGQKIVKITPDEALPEGKFKGHASICAVDPESEEFLGYLEQDVEITVRK